MRKLVLVFVMIYSCFFYGQEEGERPKPAKFVSSDRAGIIYYEAEEVTQNIKVKGEDLFYEVSKALRKYNNKVKEVAFLNSENFKALDAMVNKELNREGPRETDPVIIKKKREETQHLLPIIPNARKKIVAFNLTLDKSLNKTLSEKQYKRWIKYKKRKIKTLLPEKPKAPSSAGGNPNFANGAGGSSLGQQGGGFR